MKTNCHELIRSIADQLAAIYNDKDICRNYAWWLLETLMQQKRVTLLIQEAIVVDPEQQQQLDAWIHALTVKKMPLTYLIGSVPFLDFNLKVVPPVLIPRPETEEWIAAVINQLAPLHNQQLIIADVGTGSGCIAIALAKAFPQATIYALDIAQHALDLAMQNSLANYCNNIIFCNSDLFKQINTDIKFDIIISNPPYIGWEEYDSLDQAVVCWEDHAALFAHDQGLSLIKQLLIDAKQRLNYNPIMHDYGYNQLFIEIGYKQDQSMLELMQQENYHNIAIYTDLSNNKRMISGSVHYATARISTKNSYD